MFRLTDKEWENMRSQFVTTPENLTATRPQTMTTSQESRRKDNTPYAFTEQGVAMLSGILNSDKAISMNIAIIRAFVEIRKILYHNTDTKTQLNEIKDRLREHDAQLNQIYDAMENLLDEKAAQRKWEDRKRIGFRVKE